MAITNVQRNAELIILMKKQSVRMTQATQRFNIEYSLLILFPLLEYLGCQIISLLRVVCFLHGVSFELLLLPIRLTAA